MDFETNEHLKLALEFVQHTNNNIFLTGKAGTGKTTFLRNLHSHTPKRMIVVAPTGVAAINAGGVTIHSFFQLPFTPYIPEVGVKTREGDQKDDGNGRFAHKIRKNKIKLIRSLDLLIIDEISMVRSDLLDAIDEVLRKYRRTDKPFGGVQLLMIGDLHQLAPVIKHDEWSMISSYYESAYFFSSNALKKTDFTTVELKHIYRQADEKFIKILGEIRDNKLTQESVEALNERYKPNFEPEKEEGYITLTTHNRIAGTINESRLEKLKNRSRKFIAEVSKDFPPFMFPTEEILQLKVGAQVMFIKNDPSFDKLYYNGKIGTIMRFEDDIIYVQCDDDYQEIAVKPELWENVKYKLNEKTKEIEEDVVGSFEQYPLKLAWAITVHKSQGLTFEKAVIDVNSAFAFGQVYVALSRCKSLEGLVLISKLSPNSIKSDTTVKQFDDDAKENAPDEDKLEIARKKYQQELLLELFNFESIRRLFYTARKVYNDNISKVSNSYASVFDEVTKDGENLVYNVNNKFVVHLRHFFVEDLMPESNDRLQERVIKASKYYLAHFENLYIQKIGKVYFDADNKEVKKEINTIIERFELALVTKMAALKSAKDGFNTIKYLKSVADADIDFVQTFNKKPKASSTSNIDVEHKELYVELNSWRKGVSEESGVLLYRVLPQKTLKELIEKLPSNLSQLAKVKGFGKVKIKQFGEEVLDIIDAYCKQEGIERDTSEIEELKPKKAAKPNTKILSLELHKQGLLLADIAKERGFVESTIFGHLSHFILEGDLEITSLLPQYKFDEMKGFIQKSNTISLPKLIDACNGAYSYNELRLVISYLQKFDVVLFGNN